MMHTQEATEILANMSVGAATATGLISFIDNHASVFTILISGTGVLSAITFYYLNYRMRKKEYVLNIERLNVAKQEKQ